MPTRTGAFAVGFRQGWTPWFKDLPGLIAWADKTGFEAVDLGGGATADDVKKVQAGGLRIGSVDLADFGGLMAIDPGKRKMLQEKNVAHIQAHAAAGVKAFFACMLPESRDAKRAENYKLAVETFSPLCEAAHAAGAKLAVEGYPGGPPHFSAIGCTPESVRALVKEMPAGFGLNFDPSHLLRLGVCPVRFANEFGAQCVHAHGKDTELFPDVAYEFGIYQSATFAKPHGFGEQVWRYTIPGHGMVPWGRCFTALKAAGYQGCVCVELEDENFNGTEAGEKEGLLYSMHFLRGV